MFLLQATRLIVLYVALAIAYVCAICIYRIWFHPFSRHPGPFLAKLSNLYGAYYAWTGDLHLDMWRCHEKYGDYVRYGPNRLLVNTSEGVKAIYGHSKDFQKSNAYQVMVHRAPSTFTAIDKGIHSDKRKTLSLGFSNSALRDYQARILTHIRKLADQLSSASTAAQGWSTPQNMSKWTSYLAVDVVLDVIFGQHYDLVGKPDNRFVVQCIEDSNIRTGVLFQAKELRVGRIDRYLFANSITSRNRFIHFISSLMKRRLACTPARGDDVIQLFIDSKDNTSGMSMSELAAEGTTLLMAGSETTSTAIAATIFYLAKNSRHYKMAVEEVRAQFSRTEDIGLETRLNSCAYLKACVDEALRMSPPAASAQWRQVVSHGVKVDGQPVPAGCDVGTSIYAIHHKAAYFKEPFAFRPERWLPESGFDDADANRLAQRAFAPFSIGPRSCVAKPFALAEVMLTMATLLHRFDFKLAEGPEGDIGSGAAGATYGRQRTGEFQLWDHVAAARNGPMIQFRHRASCKV